MTRERERTYRKLRRSRHLRSPRLRRHIHDPGLHRPRAPLACDLDEPVEALQKPEIRVDVSGNGIVVDGETFKTVLLPPSPRDRGGRVLRGGVPERGGDRSRGGGVLGDALLFNWVESYKTPPATLERLKERRFRLVVFPVSRCLQSPMPCGRSWPDADRRNLHRRHGSVVAAGRVTELHQAAGDP